MVRPVKRASNGLQLVFFLFLVILVLQPFLLKFQWDFDQSLLKYLDEFCLLLVMPLVIKGIRITSKSGIQKFQFFFICYLILGMAYALGNSVPLLAMFVQAIFELKFFLVMFFMIALNDAKGIVRLFENVIKFVLIANVPFVLFQFYSPERYDEVFSAGGHTGLFVLKDSTIIRAAGMFWHQNQLAFFSAISAAFFLIVRRKIWTNLWVLLALILLIVSLQRQEMVSFLLALLLTRYWFVKESFRGKKILFLFGSVMFLLILVSLFWPFIELFVQQSGLLEVSQSIDPRVVFYYNSFIVFFDYFPFGSGFGSFGGFAAANFNQSLYNELDFGNYTWFNQNIFLTDTYYPHVIAETGLLGLLCFVAFCLNLYRFILKNKAMDIYRQYAFFSLTFLLLVSLTSPNFNDIFCLFLTFTSFTLLVKSHKSEIDVKAENIGDHTKT